jgi:hypothetical protein
VFELSTLIPGGATVDRAGQTGISGGILAAVDPYFDGLASGDGDSVPFADHCFRLENGITTAAWTAAPTHGHHPDRRGTAPAAAVPRSVRWRRSVLGRLIGSALPSGKRRRMRLVSAEALA